jgi:hypothetical protein
MSDKENEATLLEDIETLHRKLKELQSIRGYIQIVEHALKLRYVYVVMITSIGALTFHVNSESVAHQIRQTHSPITISSPSVAEYKFLQEFVAKVSCSCSDIKDGVDQQSLQIVTFLERIRDKTWADIKGALSA